MLRRRSHVLIDCRVIVHLGERQSAVSDSCYVFRHALYREVLYRRIGAVARLEVHRNPTAAVERERADRCGVAECLKIAVHVIHQSLEAPDKPPASQAKAPFSSSANPPLALGLVTAGGLWLDRSIKQAAKRLAVARGGVFALAERRKRERLEPRRFLRACFRHRLPGRFVRAPVFAERIGDAGIEQEQLGQVPPFADRIGAAHRFIERLPRCGPFTGEAQRFHRIAERFACPRPHADLHGERVPRPG